MKYPFSSMKSSLSFIDKALFTLILQMNEKNGMVKEFLIVNYGRRLN